MRAMVLVINGAYLRLIAVLYVAILARVGITGGLWLPAVRFISAKGNPPVMLLAPSAGLK